MAGQPFVQERVIRVQQIEDAAVLAHDRRKEPPRLFQHRGPQAVVEPGESLRVRREAVQPLQLQPLQGEVLDQRLGFRVLEHAPHLGVRDCPQLVLLGQLGQFLVRHGAPQEVRQPRGELVFVQRPDLGAVGTVVQFGAEQELGRAQHGLHRQLQTGLPGLTAGDWPTRPAGQPFHFVRRGGPAVGPRGESLQDLPRLLRLRLARRARQQPPRLAGRVSGGPSRSPLHDALGRRQVPLHQHGRHRQHVADVVESVADVVRREILGGIEIDAHQIADRVAIFGPVQPPHRDAARVGLGIAGGALEHVAHRADECLALRAVGCGSPSGGMPPVSTIPITLSHTFWFFSTDASSRNSASDNSASGFGPL